MRYHGPMNESAPDRQPTRREREQARHRREILAVAVGLFAERGYHETTMQMVAEASEFSVGYLYKHFPGKEDMYRELMAFHIERMDAIIGSVEVRQLGPLAELQADLEAICAHFNDHRDFMRIYHQHIGANVSVLAERKAAHLEKMVGLFTAAIAAGELRPVDARLLAAAVQGASQELFHELAERNVERPFDALTGTIFALLIDPLRN